MFEVDPDQAKLTSRVVWIALLLSQGIYVAIILFLAAQVRGAPPESSRLPMALGVVAVGTGVIAHVFWRRATGAGRAVHLPPPEPAAAFQHRIVAWVLDESIAVYAVVLGFLGFGASTWAPFSVAGAALLLVHRPR